MSDAGAVKVILEPKALGPELFFLTVNHAGAVTFPVGGEGVRERSEQPLCDEM